MAHDRGVPGHARRAPAGEDVEVAGHQGDRARGRPDGDRSSRRRRRPRRAGRGPAPHHADAGGDAGRGQRCYRAVVAVSSLLAADLLGGDALAGLGGATFTAGRHSSRCPWLSTCVATVAGRGSSSPMPSPSSVPSRRPSLGRSAVPAVPARHVPDRHRPGGNLAGRYAAADLARPEHRARAISVVVWTGTLGAVLGPTLATVEKNARGVPGFNRTHRAAAVRRGGTSSSPECSSGRSCARIRSWWPAVSPVRTSPGSARRPGPHRLRRDPRFRRSPAGAHRDGHLTDLDGRGDDDDPAAHEGPRAVGPLGVCHRASTSSGCTGWHRWSASPPTGSDAVRVIQVGAVISVRGRCCRSWPGTTRS